MQYVLNTLKTGVAYFFMLTSYFQIQDILILKNLIDRIRILI